MSKSIIAIVSVVALPVLVNLGFSEACGQEIVAVLPGLAYLYYRRIKEGDINPLGVKK